MYEDAIHGGQMLPGEAAIYKVYVVQAIRNTGNGNSAGNNAEAIELNGSLLCGNHFFTQIRPWRFGARDLGNGQQPAYRKTKAQYQVLPDQQLVLF
jgi:hypothetical protein